MYLLFRDFQLTIQLSIYLGHLLRPSTLFCNFQCIVFLCMLCQNFVYFLVFELSNIVYSWRRQWHPTPVFLPGESQRPGSLVGCCLWHRLAQSRTRLKRLSSSSSIVYSMFVYICSLQSQFSQSVQSFSQFSLSVVSDSL